MEKSKEDWEDQMSEDFQRLVVQDNETGECWAVEPQQGGCTATLPTTESRCGRLKPCWKIPKEYSLLGSSEPPGSGASGIQAIVAAVDYEPEKLLPNWTCENDDSTDQTAIIATFPPAGRLPAFCRKRKCSIDVSTIKIDSAKKSSPTCGVERFLEGRERLLFVGRLFFAFLVLLSPGYFFPLLFFIRTYCHYWKHSLEDQEEEVIATTRNRAFGFLHTRTLLKYSCRLCREHMKTEKMFRIHSKIRPEPLSKNVETSGVDLNHSTYDGCLHNHGDH